MTGNRELVFEAPRRVAVRATAEPRPGPGEVLVRTEISAVSPGSELLVYRGEAPAAMAADTALPALAGDLSFPLVYGYSAVGRVEAAGPGVERPAVGSRVFAFHPHAARFTAPAGEVVPVPDALSAEVAAMLPSMETAVTLLLDGRPLVGERVLVLGQGVVGLLTAALAARTPLASLTVADLHPLRRETARTLGAGAAVDPRAPDAAERLAERLHGGEPGDGADLTYELTGDPGALDEALRWTGFSGRVVVGSWYGTRRAALDLGGRYHRSRIRILSSQVSTLPPEASGRWSRRRRLAAALDGLSVVGAERLITHRFPFAEAARAYALLDERPDEAIQVLLTYDDD